MQTRKYLLPIGIKKDSKILVINGEKNPNVFLALTGYNVITDKLDETYDVILVVGDPTMVTTIQPKQSCTWIYVKESDEFKTDAQKQLDALDWKILKELEKLITNSELIEERDRLRKQVDIEIEYNLQ